MSRPMWVDPQHLRARGAAFAGIGDEVQRVSEQLDLALSREGRWWGDDEAGAEFEKSYAGDARQAVAALRDLARALRGFGGQVVAAAETVAEADQAGRRAVENAGGVPGTGTVPIGAGGGAANTGQADTAGGEPRTTSHGTPGGVSGNTGQDEQWSGAAGGSPARGPLNGNADGGAPDQASADVNSARGQADSNIGGEANTAADSRADAEARGGPSSATEPGADGKAHGEVNSATEPGVDSEAHGAANSAGGSGSNGEAREPNSAAGGRSKGPVREANSAAGGRASGEAGDASNAARGRANPGGPAGTSDRSVTPPFDRERVGRQSDSPAPPAGDKLPQTPGAPSGGTGRRTSGVGVRGDSRPPGAPWSRTRDPLDRSSPGAGPAREGVSPPARERFTGYPVTDPASGVVEPAQSSEPAETALARAAGALGHRHGLAVTGFDGPGPAAAVVGEFLAAVDDVLTRWPVITVRRVMLVAVGDSGVVHVAREQNSASAWYVALDKDLAADPIRLETALRTRRRPGAAVAHSDERPVYAATARAFGRALDLAGGGQARRLAQRSLIGEYLHDGNRTAGLATVVAGYKRWRDQLSGASFDRGRFDPGAALADAFTDVLLNGDSASEPAKTLCGLLTGTAAGATRSGERL